MKVIHKEQTGNKEPTKYYVLGLDDWDYFDSLVDFFVKYYGAEVHNKSDGIHTRSWQLRCQDEYFILEHNDDLGNYFYSCNAGGNSQLMDKIAVDLENRLKDIPYES